MSRKSTAKKRTTFNIKLSGPAVEPGMVPLRTLGRLLAAVQRLIDPDRDLVLPLRNQGEASKVHLMGVRKGSAIYRCTADSPEPVLQKLHLAGERIVSPDSHSLDSGFLGSIEELSEAAKSLGCVIEILDPSRRGLVSVLARIEPQTYSLVSASAFITGFTTVAAKIERVGGATEMHCGIRVSNQPRRMVICGITDESLVRKLGQYIYQDVLLEGHARWIRSSMELKRLDITGMRQMPGGSMLDCLERIRDAGGNAWDKIPDISEVLGRN